MFITGKYNGGAALSVDGPLRPPSKNPRDRRTAARRHWVGAAGFGSAGTRFQGATRISHCRRGRRGAPGANADAAGSARHCGDSGWTGDGQHRSARHGRAQKWAPYVAVEVLASQAADRQRARTSGWGRASGRVSGDGNQPRLRWVTARYVDAWRSGVRRRSGRRVRECDDDRHSRPHLGNSRPSLGRPGDKYASGPS